MKFLVPALLILAGNFALAAPATPATSTLPVAPATAFQFESVQSIDAMRKIVEADFPPGAPRAALRQRFVAEGTATPKVHPVQANTEKYIYDINLCSYYVWRWNISADFDVGGLLMQAYVNGEPVFASGAQKKDTKSLGQGAKGGGNKSAIYQMVRARPEASKGEKKLAYMLLDADSDTNTITDQLLIGGGPTRADPFNMGKLTMYSAVEPWRSIFDPDAADRIADYPGDCSKVDQFYAQRAKPAQPTGQ
jgi:hypothetical protein